MVSEALKTAMATRCICNPHGYDKECPQAFIQGGRLMHTLDSESNIKPQVNRDSKPVYFESASPSSSEEIMSDIEDQLINRPDESTHNRLQTPDDRDMTSFGMITSGLRVAVRSSDPGMMGITDNQKFTTATGMQRDQRGSLEKFRPLTVAGKSITEATIGGYRLDLGKVKQKAQEFVALPPAVLPIIFVDPDLNFLHHLFQGLEMLIGRETLGRIVESGTYSRLDKDKVLPLLKGLITSGYKDTDSELTVFVKSILSGTFDTLPEATTVGTEDKLFVAANLWGFAYIESGMRLGNSDLKMWLHMVYNQYRGTWFNSFKSSGIPAFVLQGVQDRYEEGREPDLRVIMEEEAHQIAEGSKVDRKDENDENEKKMKILQDQLGVQQEIIENLQYTEQRRAARRAQRSASHLAARDTTLSPFKSLLKRGQ
jgi:hypothetical protein